MKVIVSPSRAHHLRGRRNVGLLVAAGLLSFACWTWAGVGRTATVVHPSWHWVDPHPATLEGWDKRYLDLWHEHPKEERYDVELNHEPHNGSYTAAMVWMTNENRIKWNLASLESVARHMPMIQPYSFVHLHNGDVTLPLQKEFIKRWLERIDVVAAQGETVLADKMTMMLRHIEFAEVDLQIPHNLARKMYFEKGYGEVVDEFRWPGYHSMIRFYTVNVFWHPSLRSYDYINSLFVTPLPEDPFRKLQKAGARYAFRSETRDMDYVVVGMCEFVDSYIASREAKFPGLREKVDENRMIKSITEDHMGGFGSYESNFEVMHAPSFRRPDVADFLAHLREHDEGFYRYRWTDSPLRYATVHMFFNESELLQWDDFTYYHQGLYQVGANRPQ